MTAERLHKASPAARAVIQGMLQEPNKVSGPHLALGEAMSFTAVQKRRDNYFIAPVVRSALYEYCANATPEKRQDIAPICDAWSDLTKTTTRNSADSVSTTRSSTTTTTRVKNSSLRGAVWSHFWLAGIMLLAMR